MEKKSRRKIFQSKITWTTLPWSEVESFLTLKQNCVFKAAKRKDFYHRQKLNSSFRRDIRCNLLTIRRYSERKRPTLIFQKIIQQPNSHFNSLLFDFLKFKTLSSSQKFKLAKILFENKYFFLHGNFLSSFLNSFNRSLFVERKYKNIYEKEKFLSIYLKKLFEIFPTQKSFQAFQFYWILQLAMEERFHYNFEPELESLLEPNLSFIKSFVTFEQKRLQYQPLHCLKNLIESWFLFSSSKCKHASFKPTKNSYFNEHLFLKGSFRFTKSSLFRKKLERWEYLTITALKEMTLYGLERVRGFFFDILVERKAFKKSETDCLQSFFFSGLDLDIKKWEQSKEILSLKLRGFQKKSKVFEEKLEEKLEVICNPSGESWKGFAGKRFPRYSLSSKGKTVRKVKEKSFGNKYYPLADNTFPLYQRRSSFAFNSLGCIKNVQKTNPWSECKEIGTVSMTREQRKDQPYGLLPKEIGNRRNGEKERNLLQPTSFFLLGSEQEFLLFHNTEKSITSSLKFLKDWILISRTNICFNSLQVSNLKTGIQFQNHSILNSKNMFFCKTKQHKLEILPSKSYQTRFFEYIKKVLIVSRGKSSKFLIRSLSLVLFFWAYSIFFAGHMTLIRKIFRKLDSLLLFQILRWARRNHPNWSGQKIANKYFPRGKVWNYNRKTKKDNWVFSDISKTLYFLPKLSWFDRNDFCQDIHPQILFNGVFQNRKVLNKYLFI